MGITSDFSIGAMNKFAIAFAKAGGEPQDLNTLAEDEELLRNVLKLMPPRYYRLHVGYEDIPSYADLKKAFPGGVSELWDGTKYKLEVHESCKNADERPGEREFWVRHFGKPMTSDVVIAAAEKDGFRPATLKETLAFAAAHPDAQRKFWILALGSFALFGVHRYVPYLYVNGGERGLGCPWYADEWGGAHRFLLVRK